MRSVSEIWEVGDTNNGLLSPFSFHFYYSKTRQHKTGDMDKIKARSLWCLLITHSSKLLLRENKFLPWKAKHIENKGMHN